MLNKTKKRILSILLAGTVAAVPAYHMTLLTAEAASTDQSTSDSSTSDSNASQGEKPDGEPPEGGAPDGAPGDGTAPSRDGTAQAETEPHRAEMEHQAGTELHRMESRRREAHRMEHQAVIWQVERRAAVPLQHLLSIQP